MSTHNWERILIGKFIVEVDRDDPNQRIRCVNKSTGAFLGDCLGTVSWGLTSTWARLWVDTSINYLGVDPSPERRAAVEAALLAGEILAAVKLLCESE